MIGVWFPNIVSVSAGVVSFDGTPYAAASLTVGYGSRL